MLRQGLKPWQGHRGRGGLGIPYKMTSGRGQEGSSKFQKQPCSGRSPKGKGSFGVRDNVKGES